LIAKELRFLTTTKSLQEYVRKEVNKEKWRVAREAKCGSKKHRATQMIIKTKRLREKQFVRP
jgi:hypothetical protein